MDFDMAYIKEAMEINADDVRKGNEAINASSDDSVSPPDARIRQDRAEPS